MRILHAIGGTAVQDLNKRYQQVPPFGNGIIRQFTGNPLAMRKLAARDFEDLLQVCNTRHLGDIASLITHTQCALPVFEGSLLTEGENTRLRKLLFDLNTWHAYAKLRLHTDSTLNKFRAITTTLGTTVRMFIKEVCPKYNTTELPDEMAARGRRAAALSKTPKASKKPEAFKKPKGHKRRGEPKRKELNLSTYKYHALGDYPDLIAHFGTTDNASTQTVSSSKPYKTFLDIDPGRTSTQDDQTSIRTNQQKKFYISTYSS